MSPASKTSIAKKAHAKAEADFATWLMMAKLGGFDDLPLNAQGFLLNYRARLATMSEAESTALAVREVYSAYYIEMGGVGAAPAPKARKQASYGQAAQFQGRPKPRQDEPPPFRTPKPIGRPFLAVLLVLAGMAALALAYGFLAL